MGRRFSGKEVQVTLPTGRVVLFDEVSLTPASGAKGVTSGGLPAGWVAGEVTGEGEIKLDPEELEKLLIEAETAGSWDEMEAMDMTLYANVGGKEFRVEAFGCKLDFPDFSANKKGGEKLMHTIKFEITGEDFIHINGVPLARKNQ